MASPPLAAGGCSGAKAIPRRLRLRRIRPGNTRPGDTWCIVLAAGEGSRLRSLTTFGVECVPKQYCSVGGDASLLTLALRRARRLVPEERIVVIVAAEHRRWWRRELAQPPEHVVVQPRNRGTAVGVLLPLLRIQAEDPAATVVLLPADHHFDDEWTLATAAQAALASVRRSPQRIFLLGVEPEAADAGLGWLVPAAKRGPLEAVAVESFCEKPSPAELEVLLRRGALVNTLVLAAQATALTGAFEAAEPWLLDRCQRCGAGTAGPRALGRLYAGMAAKDFSRHVLERVPSRLSVLRVPACGWSDLGTPERIARRFAPVSLRTAGRCEARQQLAALVHPPSMAPPLKRLVSSRRHGTLQPTL